ncbi:MAG: RND transporter, partial [Aliiglaciecola sp.]
MKNIAKNLVHLCTHKPKSVYGILLLFVLLLASQIPRIQIDTDPENMLDAEHPARVFHNQVKQTFSMYDAIVVGVVNTSDEYGVFKPDVLTDIFDITKTIMSLDGVVSADVMSISTVDNISQEGEGAIRFEWMMPTPPESISVSQQIQQKLSRLPLLQDTLASNNGKAAAIYVPILDKNQSFKLAEQIRAAIQARDSSAQWYITGLPVAEDQFGFEMFLQMGISARLTVLT